MLGVIVGG